MSRTGPKPLAVLVLAGLALSQVACVSGIARNQGDLEHYLNNNLTAEALEVIELRRRVSRNKSIYLLDKAMLLRMQQQFEESNTAFEQAKDVIEELDAISLREQASAVTINDLMRSYLPPTFERVLIHCFKAMNFLELRQYDDARVEVLQLDEFLKQQDDFRLPFARYLSGLVFEFNQEPDNALIAYRKAYEAYRDRLPGPSRRASSIRRRICARKLADATAFSRAGARGGVPVQWPDPAQAQPRNPGAVAQRRTLAPHFHTVLRASPYARSQRHAHH